MSDLLRDADGYCICYHCCESLGDCEAEPARARPAEAEGLLGRWLEEWGYTGSPSGATYSGTKAFLAAADGEKK